MDRQTAEATVKGYLEDYLRGQGINTRKPFQCLNPDHTDSNPSMSYDRKRNKCHCFSCGADYSILDLIGIDYGLTDTAEIYKQAYSLYGLEVDSYRTTAREDFKEVSTKSSTKPNNNTDTHNSIHTDTYTQAQPQEDFLAYYDKCGEALAESGYSYTSLRGLTEATVKKYRLGLEKSFNKGTGGAVWEALIIPTGRHTYTARNTDPEAEKKNRVRKVGHSVIFNTRALREAKKPIYIVEGELDALSIIDVGGEAVGLGSTANYRQLVAYLQKNKPEQPLIVALDNDTDGQKTAEALVEELEKLQLTFYRLDPYNGKKDANEALTSDRGAFKKAIEEADHIQEQELQEAKEAYLQTATASHIQDFINGIADSVNTPAIATGFPKLDKVLDGGLYEGLYICGAISSLGKTTLALQIADQIAQAGTDVLIFSLEMARSELMAKSISRLTLLDVIKNKGQVSNAKTTRGVTSGARYSKYSTEERELIQRAITAYSGYAGNIYINEGVGDIGVQEVRETIKKHILFTGRKPVVVIDYVQILAPAEVRATDKQNIDKAVLELKRISRDFKLPLIGISSVNRANYNTPISMEALKESGNLEFGSDVIWGLQLKGVGKKDFDVNEAKAKNPREVELVVLKNRNGATGGKVTFEYYPLFNYFTEV